MSGSSAEFPTYQDLVITGLTRSPEVEAIVDGHLRLTGRDLHDRVARTVAVYRSLGLGGGSRLALIGPNSADYLVAQLSAAALGVTFTGLHPLASVAELGQVLRALAPQALVFGLGATGEKVAELRTDWPEAPMTFLSLGPGATGTDLLALERAAPVADLADPTIRVAMAQTASISFTGGTTGNPKVVMRSQRALACSVTTMLAEWDWPSVLRFLALAPLTHATGSIVPAVLLRGGSVHVRAGFDVDDVHRQLIAERITATFLVPTMIYRLLERSSSDDADLAGLRLIIYGAAAISAVRLAEGILRWGPIFMQLYGQVEAPNTICTLKISEHRADDLARLASCGRPTMNVEVALMDAVGTRVPLGEPGEICVRGPLLMDGYLDDPVATSAAIRDGWLRTGDMAISNADGFLTIVDRIKDMIVTGGFNIFAGDVERALTAHPLVRDCAVIGVPDDVWGEAVLAYVIPASLTSTTDTDDDAGRDADAATLAAHVRAAKGSAWVPKRIVFVPVLPVTALGKPDKKALRARHWTAEDRTVH